MLLVAVEACEVVLLVLLCLGWSKLNAMTAGGIDDTLHELGLYIKHGILKLQETWKEIGINEEEQAQKCESVVASLRSVLDSLVIGERTWLECLDEECQVLCDKCNEHFKQLGLPPFHPDSITLPLLSKQDFLINKNTELEAEIKRKREEIEELEQRKISCITKLGLQPDHYPSIQSDNVNRIVSQLQIQIKEFEEDMGRRTKCLHQQLSTLAELMDSLQVDRCGLIEEGLISDEPDSLLLSDDSIQRRNDLISKYRSELVFNTQDAVDLKHRITRLHRLLDKDTSLDPKISKKFDCSKPSSLTFLREALTKMEQRKQEKLESYVAGLKEEIKTFEILCFQTRCEVSSSEDTAQLREDQLKTSSTDTLDLPDIILDDIENREPSNSDKSTLELSDKSSDEMPDKCSLSDKGRELEEELEAWESFYRSNNVVFDMIRKWKDLNDRYLELQTPSPDKYNNRGGSLLQSQKEAAKITKEIPKLEAKVISEVEKLDGEVIKVNGLCLQDYFLEYRSTSSLNRINSLRRTRKKSAKAPRKSSSSESGDKSCRTLSAKSEPQPRSKTPQNLNSLETRSAHSRRSLRKRVSREGLDRVGLK